jgi:hypothetical protein
MDRRFAFIAAVLLLVMPYPTLAKKFTRCGLAAELRKHGVTDLRNCE